jgi:hypothetical protein
VKVAPRRLLRRGIKQVQILAEVGESTPLAFVAGRPGKDLETGSGRHLHRRVHCRFSGLETASRISCSTSFGIELSAHFGTGSSNADHPHKLEELKEN